MTDWYSVATPEQESRLVEAWPDAPFQNRETCGMLLDVARDQVIAFAPAPPAPGVLEVVDGFVTSTGAGWSPTNPPSNYVYAQLQQAINLWNAGRVSSGGDVGVDAFTFTPRPLDKTIKSIIRPIDGKPHVL